MLLHPDHRQDRLHESSDFWIGGHPARITWKGKWTPIPGGGISVHNATRPQAGRFLEGRGNWRGSNIGKGRSGRKCHFGGAQEADGGCDLGRQELARSATADAARLSRRCTCIETPALQHVHENGSKRPGRTSIRPSHHSLPRRRPSARRMQVIVSP